MAKSWAQVRAAVGKLDPVALPFQIRVFETSALGPIAFVDGDLDAARSILMDQGVAHVYRYDHGPEGGGDPVYHVSQALGWLVEEAVENYLADVHLLPGYVTRRGSPATITLLWYGAVPDAVTSLVGVLPNGVCVDPVVSVPFSLEHLREAQEKVSKAIRSRIVEVEMSMLGIDSDYSSLYLGVVEPDADRRQEIAQELQSIVDVPVEVVFEERWTECVG